jgi:uncharacterized protein
MKPQDNKQSSGNQGRGFAGMDKEAQRVIASKGGSSVPSEERTFSKDHELAREAGQKGGQNSHKNTNGHDEKENDEEAGRKGRNSSSGNFANNPQRASEAGRKGGQSAHGGSSSSGR